MNTTISTIIDSATHLEQSQWLRIVEKLKAGLLVTAVATTYDNFDDDVARDVQVVVGILLVESVPDAVLVCVGAIAL